MTITNTNRPVVFDYESVTSFVGDMLAWLRQTDPSFSVRRNAAAGSGCSPALVTQIIKGRRSLTRDRVGAIASLLRLSPQESRYLDQWVAHDRLPNRAAVRPQASRPPLPRPGNHLMSHWLHPYVKEACRLAGFKAEPAVVHRLLGGIAPVEQVSRSLRFLFREGFLRRNQSGKAVLAEPMTVTSDDVSNTKVRNFHRHALEVAKRGLDLYPVHMRRADTYVLAVNEKNLDALKKIMISCMDDVEQFERDHADEDERLYQVTLHLTPIGGSNDKLH